MKKDLTLALSKENKKTDKNEELILNLSSFDKASTMLVGYLEPKFEKKSLKKELSVSRDLSQSSSTVFDESSNYCK